MREPGSLPFTATADDYTAEAEELFKAFTSGDDAAAWRYKWEHPRFKGKTIVDVNDARPSLDFSDAQMVVARQYSFNTWDELIAFANDLTVARFEEAVDAVVDGDLDKLRTFLREDPSLVHARSKRRHHCTLLHYLGANGVEGGRQKTPANAVEVMKLLLDSGAEPDSLADLYDSKCTTMSMLVSSCHPANAGLQAALAETLLDYGAAYIGPGDNWNSAVLTALTFGYVDTAEALARRGAPIDDLPSAAGLNRVDDVARLLPSADAHARHLALALATQLGHAEVVRLLLDAGEDPSRFNPDGFHSHATPLHNAVWNEEDDVVRLLVERGARLDILDRIYLGTPLDWAVYGKKEKVAEYLREHGAPSSS